VGQPVSIAGVLVRAGDIVVGDADGVVVVPAEDWADVEVEARGVQAAERGIRDALDDGVPLADRIALPSRPEA
jgi:4-hydroxy-4-methyl-2-oxoglutarate aldolase